MPPRMFRRRFTLIELLIVIAIIGILATLLLTGLAAARRRTQAAVARSQISAIKAALAMYEADMGRYPRRAPRPTPGNTNGAFDDDGPALYAALRNRPTLEAGGGQNSPYLQDWKAENVGKIDTQFLSPGQMGQNGTQGTGLVPLQGNEADLLNQLQFQIDNAPDKQNPLVLLDPWGNPYHYREWASVRSSVKDDPGLPANRNITPPDDTAAQGEPPVDGPVIDRPHAPEGFDIWSNGPNGINEFGDPNSDDVTSWSDAR